MGRLSVSPQNDSLLYSSFYIYSYELALHQFFQCAIQNPWAGLEALADSLHQLGRNDWTLAFAHHVPHVYHNSTLCSTKEIWNLLVSLKSDFFVMLELLLIIGKLFWIRTGSSTTCIFRFTFSCSYIHLDALSNPLWMENVKAITLISIPSRLLLCTAARGSFEYGDREEPQR